MKTHITLTLQPEDYGGERGKEIESPLARAMSRETGLSFRHAGRMLWTMDEGTHEVAQVYNLGQAGSLAWSQWCTGIDPIGTFEATLLPQTDALEPLQTFDEMLQQQRRTNLPPLLDPVEVVG